MYVAMFSAVLLASAHAKPWSTIDFPGGGATLVTAINGKQVIAGPGGPGFFTRTKGGAFHSFTGNSLTMAGIDYKGNVAGSVIGDDSNRHGYILDTGLQMQQFDVPGHQNTAPTAVNSKGDIAGVYDGGNFVRTAAGAFQTFNVGGGPAAINDARTVAGAYSNTQVFLRDVNGNVTTFTIPNSLGEINVAGITKNNVVAGSFINVVNGYYTYHGYEREADGSVAVFDVPQAGTTMRVTGINDDGYIVGYYADANGVYHGFARRPDGTIASFDVPGVRGTYFMGVSPAGKVVGYYIDNGFNYHGLRVNAKAAGF